MNSLYLRRRAGVLFLALGFSSLSLNADSKDVVQLNDVVQVKKGETRDHAVSLFGSVQVDGVVDSTALAFFGDVRISDGAEVKGDAISIGGQVIRGDKAIVGGRVVSLPFPLDNIEELLLMSAPVMATVAAAAFGIAAVLSSVGFVAVIALVLLLFESHVERARREIDQHPVKTFVVGILGFASIFPVLAFLTLTIIGIPLAFAVAGVTAAALVLGIVAVGLSLGARVASRMKWKIKPLWRGLIGFAILLIASFVPIVGLMIQISVLFFGLGAVMLTRFRPIEP